MPLAACGHSPQIFHSQPTMYSSSLQLPFQGLVAQCPPRRVALFPQGQTGHRGGCVGRQELGTFTGKNAKGLGCRLCLPYHTTKPGNEAPSLPSELLRRSGEVVLREGLLCPSEPGLQKPSLYQPTPLPQARGRPVLRSPPQHQPQGQLPDFARLSVALAEENGVGHTYLGEFGAHHQEDQEAEELPGRLHVSRPLRCPGVRGLGYWRPVAAGT